MDVPAGKAVTHLARHLRQNLLPRWIVDLVDGVKPQTVEVKLVEPIEHVVDEKLAHRLTVEGDGASPRRMTRRVEEVRRIEMEVIPFGSEMVVDHVEQDHEAARVRGVDQALQAFRPAIGDMGRVEQHAIIAPTAIACELGHWQELDDGDADIDETVEVAGDAVEGAFGREGARVQLVDDGLFPRPSCPVRDLPFIASRVDEPAHTVHVALLRARRGVWHAHTVERGRSDNRRRGGPRRS